MIQEKTPQIKDLQGGSGTAKYYTAWQVKNCRDEHPESQNFTWPELAALLTTPATSDSKDGTGIIFQTLDGRGRKVENTLSAWAVCLDIEPATDKATGEIVQPRPFAEVCADLHHNFGRLAAAYTTHSHCVPSELIDGKPYGERYRLVFPLDREMPLEALQKACRHIAEQLQLPAVTVDSASWARVHVMYLPRHRQGYPFDAKAFEGKPWPAAELEALPELEPSKPAKSLAMPLPVYTSHQVGGVHPYVQTVLNGECAELATTPAGGRNNALNNSALRLYRLALGGHIGEVQVTAALEQAAMAAGLPLSEIRTTLGSAQAAANREGAAHPSDRTGQQLGRDIPPDIAADLAAIVAAKAEPEPVSDDGKCPRPFRGEMAEIVRLSLERQPRQQPALTVAAALAGMSAALHGKYATETGLRGNLYLIGLAGSTSGKGSPLELVKVIASIAGNTPVSNIGSGQGIEDSLAKAEGSRMALAIDEVGHLLGCMSGQRADSHMQVAGKMLLELFSASGSVHTTRVLAGGDKPSQHIYNPYLTLYGTTTHAKMQGIDPAMITDGTLGRCLVVNGLDYAPMRELPAGLPNLWGVLKHTIGDKAEVISRYGAPQAWPNEQEIIYLLDTGARALHSATIARLREQERKCDGVKRMLIGRRLELAQRVALVLAVWDHAGGENGTIRREHLQWGLDFVTYSHECLLSFVEEMTDSQVIKNGRKVLAGIADACEGRLRFGDPRVNRIAAEYRRVQHSALLKWSKLDSRAFGEAITWLTETDQIIVENMEGKAKFYLLTT